jgi:U3 small nucleolar RNA-associated protein 11
MSSTMRNAIQRRNHRERAQPAGRAKWGLLEKHKDYSLRAADHKEKRKRIKVLREKARDRNPDEFSFGMMSTKTSNGIKLGDRGNKALSHDVVQLLKTQDAGYLRTMLQRTKREIEKLQGALMLDGTVDDLKVGVVGRKGDGRKTVFVDGVAEQRAYKKKDERVVAPESEDEDELSDEEGEDGKKVASKTAREDEWGNEESEPEDDGSEVKMTKERRHQVSMLKALKTREKELLTASQELDLQRARMSNSIGGVNKNGVKFKVRERKR